MARIGTYASDIRLNPLDKLIGTDQANLGTKNYTLKSITDWAQSSNALTALGTLSWKLLSVDDQSPYGTFTATPGGVGTPLASITTIRVNRYTTGGDDVAAAIVRVFSEIVEAISVEDPNVACAYRVVSVTQDPLETDYFDIVLSEPLGAGALVENISLVFRAKGGGVTEWGGIEGTLADQIDLYNALTARELVANKSTEITLGTSDVFYPTQNAVKSYVDAAIGAIPPPITPTLDSVTGAGNTTQNGIIIGSLTLGELTYPNTDGSQFQILQTDGAGNIVFTDLPNSAVWGNVSGTITDQADLTTYVGAEINTAPYATIIGDTVESVQVGGADPTPAAVWKTKTLIQALDTILFPTILPTIGTAKSVVLTLNGSTGNREVGVSYSRTLTAAFNRGTIINGDGTTNPNPLVGAATNYRFTGTGISQTDQPGNTLAITTDVVLGDNDWDVVVTHSAGTGDYFDNKGVAETNLDGSRVAGTTSDTNASPNITGYYPYYWGVSATPVSPSDIATIIQGGGGNKVIANASGTVTVTFNASTEFLWMVHYASYTTKTKWYNTALNNGNIGGASDLFGPVNTELISSAQGYWNNINYKCYISSFATTTSGSIEFRNS